MDDSALTWQSEMVKKALPSTPIRLPGSWVTDDYIGLNWQEGLIMSLLTSETESKDCVKENRFLGPERTKQPERKSKMWLRHC